MSFLPIFCCLWQYGIPLDFYIPGESQGLLLLLPWSLSFSASPPRRCHALGPSGQGLVIQRAGASCPVKAHPSMLSLGWQAVLDSLVVLSCSRSRCSPCSLRAGWSEGHKASTWLWVNICMCFKAFKHTTWGLSLAGNCPCSQHHHFSLLSLALPQPQRPLAHSETLFLNYHLTPRQ